MFFGGLSVKPSDKAVEPCPTEPEPAAGTGLLASEVEDKTAVSASFDGEPRVGKFEMLVTLFVGILDGCPDGHQVGMEPGVRLSEAARKAKICVVVGEHAERTSDDFFFVFYQENLG